jgi:SAM-dependent methyltransferase
MAPETWHYGVIARYWAEFRRSGPEIAYFQQFVEAGQPALDVACGTGRLLLPYLRTGLDVDGCDVSPDMLALCREAAEREGLQANLYAQPMHELDIPRRYRTIFICGGFGLGATRAQDRQALVRLYEHLEPGGLLVLDTEVPYADEGQWLYWLKGKRRTLPQPWPAAGDREVGSDGAEYELLARLTELDPLEQRVGWQMRARMWRDGELVADEESGLSANLYFKQELVALLEQAGFVDIEILGAHNGAPATADDDFLVFSARRRG